MAPGSRPRNAEICATFLDKSTDTGCGRREGPNSMKQERAAGVLPGAIDSDDIDAATDGTGLYKRYVNRQWVELLNILRMDVRYVACRGSTLQTADGRRIMDFNSGYCVYNTGHNHPSIVAALKNELDNNGPNMLQSHVSELAGLLAARLCASAGGRLSKVYFGSSGSEGVDTTIKFARAFTGRNGILYAKGGFHGLTCSSLSLMSNPFWHARFGPMLQETEGVPFGDAMSLEDKVRTRRYAAFIVEPVQAENGVILNANYLREAELLCRRYGTLFVLDEVQTGLYRTGTFLAAHRFKLNPDMVILAKALSGGFIPCGAVLMSEAICDAIYDSLDHAFIHTSTFSENALAMRAGLATLDALEAEQLGENAEQMGAYLRQQLHEALGGYEMVGTIQGVGLLNGICFRPPSSWRLRLPYEGFRKFHPGLFGQMFVMRLFNKGNMLTQICGNDFMTLKVAPPLSVTRSEIDEFVQAITGTVDEVHHSAGFWSEGLKLFARASKVS